MKILLQKVQQAKVTVDDSEVAHIGNGVLFFVGIHKNDTEKDIDILLKKVLEGRIFPNIDHEKCFDISLTENHLDILVVSQFTLYANMKKGRRPSFDEAAPPQSAKILYEKFIEKLSTVYSGRVAAGIFQANMQVSLINDGPVTFIYDSFDL